MSDSELDVELGDDGNDDDDDDDDSSSDGEPSSGEDDDEDMDIASDTDDEDVREAMRRRLKSLSTPQPAGPKKKQKIEPVAASAPAKVGNPKVPTNEAEYGAALRAYIQQHGGKDGSVPLQQLGNSVKRPAAVSRLKKYLEANGDKFAVDKKTNTVKLA